jgi:ABC-type molybdate transport system substrate-binding protein
MKVRPALLVALTYGLTFGLSGCSPVNAAEIKVLTARAIATVLDKIGPEFEHQSGHKLKVISGFGPVFVQQINAGEPFDIFVSTPATLDGLFKEGKLLPTHARILCDQGSASKCGQARPNLTSVLSKHSSAHC